METGIADVSRLFGKTGSRTLGAGFDPGKGLTVRATASPMASRMLKKSKRRLFCLLRHM
jgi:hypothetical protein